MKFKALFICALLLASMLMIVSAPASAELAPEDYNLTKYDPKDDIIRVRTGGDFKNSDHPNVDIVRMKSEFIENNELISTDDEIRLTMTVEGTIQNSDSYKYAFAVQVDGDLYLFVAFQKGQPVGMKYGNPNPLNPLQISASGAGTKTLTITFDLSLITSHSSSYDISGGSVYSVGDYERYVDLAPDKLVLITEPSDHSTTVSSVTIKGVIRESIDNKPGTDVQISIDGGTYESVTGTDSWSYGPLSLGNGEHTVSVKVEGADVDNAEDEITITVDSDTAGYDEFDQKPQLNIGNKYTYAALEDAQISGIEIPLSTDMIVQVKDLKTITVDGDDFEVYEMWSNGTGGQDLGYVEFTNDVDKTTWRERDGFEIVQEITYTTNTATLRDPTWTETLTTYSDPYDTHNGFSVKVGFANIWYFDTNAHSESKTKVGSGSWETNDPYDEPLHYTGECLYYMESMNVFGESYDDVYVIRGYLENPGVSIVEYYSTEIDMPIRIDTFDTSRNLLASLGLYYADIKPFSVVIDEISFDPEKPKADSDNDIIIKVKNIGNTDAANVKVTVKDGDREVASETISSILARQSDTQIIKWKPKGEGAHMITVTLSHQGDDLGEKSVPVEVDPPDEDDGGGIFFIIIIIMIIVAVVILVLVMAKARGAKKGEAEVPETQGEEAMATPAGGVMVVAEETAAPAATKEPATQMKEETIQCPSCKTNFTIQFQSKPVKVKCPSCGMEGVLK